MKEYDFEPNDDVLRIVRLHLQANPNITAQEICDLEKKHGTVLMLKTIEIAMQKESAGQILLRPDIFDHIISRELSKLVEGERHALHVLFLCAQGRLVENSDPCSYNILVNSESGAGKDWVVRNLVKILPQESYEYRTRISKKAFTYWHRDKPDSEWTWDAKVCYLEDISNDVLNDDVFKVMASSGSHATIVMDGIAVDIKIKGKPVIILTSASASPKHELLRRFAILTLDESMNQTKAIMKRKAVAATKGKIENIEYDPAIIEAQRKLQRVKIRVPFAELFTEIFPADHIIMRTLFSRFLDWIKASCAFHQFQREKDDNDFYVATGQDYEIARQSIEAVTTNKYMLPLTKNQLKIIEIAEDLSDPFEIDDISPKVNFISERTLRRQLDKLTEFGFFTKSQIRREESNRPVLLFHKNPLGSLKLPTWSELLSIRQPDNYVNDDN